MNELQYSRDERRLRTASTGAVSPTATRPRHAMNLQACTRQPDIGTHIFHHVYSGLLVLQALRFKPHCVPCAASRCRDLDSEQFCAVLTCATDGPRHSCLSREALVDGETVRLRLGE